MMRERGRKTDAEIEGVNCIVNSDFLGVTQNLLFFFFDVEDTVVSLWHIVISFLTFYFISNH